MILSLIAIIFMPLAAPLGMLRAADRPNIPWITAGELIVERPTLICLGFQWYTSGDDNKNAKGTVKFRRVGNAEWKAGLDLWRLNGQRCISYHGEDHDFYEPPQMFAGSLFDLEPDTQYECVLTMSDPDGVMGTAEQRAVVRTRREPRPPADSRILHLGGAKSDFPDFRAAVDALVPGDTLLVHRGVYRLSRPSDTGYLDNHVFTLDVQGTAERPVTIKAAGDGEVVFDGQGNYMLFDVQNAQHLILDGLTIRGADFAVYAGGTLPCENQGIVVRDCTYTNIKRNVQGFVDTERGRSGETAGRVRHVGGPSEVVDGVSVNPKDGGRVFRSLGNALFGDDRWTQDRCGRSSKRRNDLVRPGDTIIVHLGETLLDHSKKSHWGPCYFYNSTIVLNLKGTPDRPITIRGEGRPVFDGVGNYKIFDVQGSEHLVIEGLHFENASFAVYKGEQTVRRPVVGLTVRRCPFEDVGCGVYGISGANRDFLISDNVFIGRCNEIYPVTEQNKGRAWAHDEASYSAVHLAGQGHVICHNDVYRFFDGLQMQSNWATSPTVNTYWTAGGDEPVELRTSAVDIYNNILRWTPDNAIEADMAHHNIRIMRNLCVDTFGCYWSNQFVMGGPCYWIRNVAYAGCPYMYKNDAGPVGVYSLHNTFIGGMPESWPPRRVNVGARRFTPSSSHVSCGDLILKPGDSAGIFSNPPAIHPRHKKQAPIQFKVDDFMPTERSPAIDRASDILPNINDEYAGHAPDLGAIEFGKALPHYGPRDPANLMPQGRTEMKQNSTLMVAVLVLAPSVCAADLRARVETGLRKSLIFYEQQQHGGGWASAYSLDLKQRWGEHLKVDQNVVTVNHCATTGVGLIFIKAAKVLNDPDLLVHARKAGDLLIAGQLPDGGFTEELRLTEAGVKPVGNQGVLEDHTTDRATELLLQLFDATGDKKYLAAGRKAVDFLIQAQYPSGAFPQRYPINIQSLTGPYSRLYTINDGATSDPILRLISFYRRGGERKYLDAAKRAGDWLISAVLPDPTPGWAEQYDLKNKPAKARSFEPPGTGAEVTVLSIQALIELYLATGDKKYLGPVPKAVKWLESTRVGKEGKCFRLYDMNSGKAIFVDRKSGNVYHDVLKVPVPEQSRWYMGPYFKETPAAAVSEIEIWRRLEEMGREKLLAQRLNHTGRHDIESGYNAFRTPEIVTEEDREALTKDVTRILQAQNAAGWWQGERYGVMTINSKSFTFNAIRLITWLEVNTDGKANSR